MQGYDIIMLLILGLTTVRGYIKGLAWQLASIASIAVSYVVSYKFRDQVAVHIDIPDPWRGLVSMLALFVCCSLLIWFLFQNIKGAIEKAKLKDFDQQLGAIFGAVKGAAICVVVTLFAVSLLSPAMTQQIVNSRSGGYIARVVDLSKTLIPEEIHQVLEPYLRKAEDRLQERQTENPGVALGGEFQPLPPSDEWFGLPNRSQTSQGETNDSGWR